MRKEVSWSHHLDQDCCNEQRLCCHPGHHLEEYSVTPQLLSRLTEFVGPENLVPEQNYPGLGSRTGLSSGKSVWSNDDSWLELFLVPCKVTSFQF